MSSVAASTTCPTARRLRGIFHEISSDTALPTIIIRIATLLFQASRGPPLAVRLEAEAGHLPLLTLVKHFLWQVHEGLRNIQPIPRTNLVEDEVRIVSSLKIFDFLVRYAPLLMILLVCQHHYGRILNICARVYLLDPAVNIGKCLTAAQVGDYDKALGTSSYLKIEEAYLK